MYNTAKSCNYHENSETVSKRILINMGRFLRNLKQKTIAGAGGPTSAELRDSGQTLFIESRNLDELDELILIQRAHELQLLNQGIIHPGLSTILETTVNDSGTPVNLKVPVNQEVFQMQILAIKNTSGGAAAVTIAATDGTTSVPLILGLSVANGETKLIISPLAFDGSTSSLNASFNIDSSFYLVASSDAEVTAIQGLRTISLQ